MKKILSCLLLAAAVSVSACWSSTFNGYYISGAAIPYISHINGKTTTSAIDVEYTVDSCVLLTVTGGGLSGKVNFHHNEVSTNGPFAFVIDVYMPNLGGPSNNAYSFDRWQGPILNGLIWQNLDNDPQWLGESGLRISLYYRVPGSDHMEWVAEKVFKHPLLASIRGIIFDRVELPPLLDGTTVEFLLKAEPLVGSSAQVTIYQSAGIWSLLFKNQYADLGREDGLPYLIGQNTPVSLSTVTNAKVRISGGKRPDRSK